MAASELQILSRIAVRAAKRSSRVAGSLHTLAVQLYQQGQYGTLLDVVDVMIEKTGTPFGYILRAATYLELKDNEMALSDIKRAIHLDTSRDYPLAYLVLSEIHLRMGDKMEAARAQELYEEVDLSKEEEGVYSTFKEIFLLAYKGDPNAMYQLSERVAKISLREVSALNSMPIDFGSEIVGRNAFIANIQESLSNSVVTITGVGGIGKTTIASAIGKEWLQTEGHSMIWIKFEPDSTVDSLCDTVGRSLTEPAIGSEQSSEKKKILTRALLERYPNLLVILDDVWLPHVARAFVTEVIPSSARTLLTSRMMIDGLGTVIRLDSLTIDDATVLLNQYAPTSETKTQQLLELLGYHPLAIRLAGGLLAESKSSVESLILRLQQTRQSSDPGFEVWDVLTLSFQLLDTDAQETLLIIGMCPDKSVGVELLEILIGKDKLPVRQLMDRLITFGLARKNGEYRIIVHDTVWSYARAVADDLGRSETIRKQLLSAILTYTSRHTSTQLNDLDALELEIGNILGIAAEAALRNAYDDVINLAYDLVEGEFLYTRGYYRQTLELLASAIQASRETQNRQAEAAHLNNLALIKQSLGNHQEAIENYMMAIEINRSTGNRQGESNNLGNLGNAYAALGQVENAIQYLEKAILISQEFDDRRSEQTYLRRLGAILSDIDRHDEAIAHLNRALTLSRHAEDIRAEADVLGNLALVYGSLKEFDRSRLLGTEALSKSREIRDIRGEASNLIILGRICQQMQQLDQANEYFSQALELSRSLGDRTGQTVALTNLGQIKLSLVQGNRVENLEQAVDYFSELLSFFNPQEHSDEWAITTVYIANVYLELYHDNKIEQAIELYEKALQVLTRAERPFQWASAIVNLANAYRNRVLGSRSENIEKAISLYEKALEVITREHPTQLATILINLGNGYQERFYGSRSDNIEHAVNIYHQALQVITRKDAPNEWATTLVNLANASLERIVGSRAENIEEAIAYYEQALEVKTRDTRPMEWATTIINLANAYRIRVEDDRSANIEKAIHYYEQALEIITLQETPAEWVTAVVNLGNAYLDRKHGDRIGNVEKGINYYNQALQVRTREASPIEWANINNNLGNGYSERLQGDRTENLDRAIQYYAQALSIYTRENFPEQWALTQLNMANAYRDKGTGDSTANLEQAISYYQEVLNVFTRDFVPEQWAITTYNLAIAYSQRKLGSRETNLEKALNLANDVLEIFETTGNFKVDEVRNLIATINSNTKTKDASGISISVGGNVSGNINAAQGDIYNVGNISGSVGVAIGRGAQSVVIQGSNNTTTVSIFDEAKAKLHQMAIDPFDKEDVESELKKLKELDVEAPAQDRVDHILRKLERIAPDVVETLLEAAINPAAAIGKGLRTAIKVYREARLAKS